jgi:hypothetical protein
VRSPAVILDATLRGRRRLFAATFGSAPRLAPASRRAMWSDVIRPNQRARRLDRYRETAWKSHELGLVHSQGGMLYQAAYLRTVFEPQERLSRRRGWPAKSTCGRLGRSGNGWLGSRKRSGHRRRPSTSLLQHLSNPKTGSAPSWADVTRGHRLWRRRSSRRNEHFPVSAAYRPLSDRTITVLVWFVTPELNELSGLLEE